MVNQTPNAIDNAILYWVYLEQSFLCIVQFTLCM